MGDLRLSAAFGGGGAGQSLLVLYMPLKRATPWLFFKIKLVRNAHLVVEKQGLLPSLIFAKQHFLGLFGTAGHSHNDFGGVAHENRRS